MSKITDLVASFARLAMGVVELATRTREQRMTDGELLREVAYHVHHDHHSGIDELSVLSAEISRRLIERPSNHVLRPYGEAILSLSPNLRDNGYSLKEAFKDLTAPIYATFTSSLERALERR